VKEIYIRKQIAASCNNLVNWEKYTLLGDKIFYEGQAVAKYELILDTPNTIQYIFDEENCMDFDLTLQLYKPLTYMNLTLLFTDSEKISS